MAQQTAVDYIKDEFKKLIESGTLYDVVLHNDFDLIYDIFEQAEEMEKQQIESAWKRGDGEHDKVADELSKKYYTKTYGK